MSFIHSPKIVSDQLALYLDASNINSYSISYTGVWKDLTTYNNPITYGNVRYNNDGRGYFDFVTATGINSRSDNSSIGFTFNRNMVNTSGNFTFSCWIRDAVDGGQLGLFSNAAGPDGYRFGPGTNNVYYLVGSGAYYTEGSINYTNPATLSTGVWYNISTVFNRDNSLVSCYINGNYQGSATLPVGAYQFPLPSNNIPGIVRSACCSIWSGKLATFSVHNKDLSQAEIIQNFNALRGRFGV